MTIFPVFLPMAGCPFKCIYCEQHTISNTSTINWQNIKKQLAAFMAKQADNQVEIAFYGGTFTALAPHVRKRCYRLVNNYPRASIRISTRPDYINQEILAECHGAGVKTIELGIQSFCDKVLTASERGYTSDRAIAACELIQANDFNLGVQLLPGLPGANKASYAKTLATLIRIAPHYLRIYPLLVLAGTKLASLYATGQYTPLTIDLAVDICTNWSIAIENTPTKLIKCGLHAFDTVHRNCIIAGPYHAAFGELVKANIMFKNIIKTMQSEDVLSICPYDISLFKGNQAALILRLKQALKTPIIKVKIDTNLIRSKFLLSKNNDYASW